MTLGVTSWRLRTACGMGNSWKAAKKSRRIAGVNVFQQTRMRGQHLRIGTAEYKAMHKEIMNEWRALSERERAIYDAVAERQQESRMQETKKTLKEVASAEFDDPSLSSAQKRRLGQKQLNHSLQALSSHPVWQSGLSIANHVAALRPALVQNVDPASSLLEAFDYLPQPEENPAVMPHMFCSCAEAHPDLCKSAAHYQHVLLMVQQFQRCLEVHKIECMALFKMEIDCSQPSGAASSQIGFKPLWLLLGCVSKRPLSHVFGKLVQHRQAADVVTPLVEGSSWQLCTLHGVLSDLARDVASKGLDLDDVRVCFRCHSYDAIQCKDVPNHFRVSCDALEFKVGFKVLFLPKPKKQADATTLPFGMKSSAPARAGRGRPKAKPPRPAAKAPKHGDQEAGAEAGADDDLLDSEEANPDVAPSCAFAFRNMGLHDSSPLCPAHLPATAQEEVAEAARGVARQHLDAEVAEIPVELPAPAVPEPSSSSGRPAPVTEATAEAKPSKLSTKFNKVLGLVGCTVVKRRVFCYTCQQQIHKGDYRLEYAFSHSKPVRSVHPECVGQIDAKTIGASISWLQGKLNEFGADDQSEEAQSLRHAFDRLRVVDGR